MFIKPGYPDVVYFVKPSEDNEELRYSLRSLKNLNHGRVFIVGYKPTWVGDHIEYIAVEQLGEKYDNIKANWQALLQDDRISDKFILMNDDFFVLQPTKRIVPLRRLKPLDHYIELFSKVDKESFYVESMKKTKELLHARGLQDIDSYELHTPMLFSIKKIRELFNELPADFPVAHIRTLYGNLYKIGGERVKDVKIIANDQPVDPDAQFVSTLDGTFQNGLVGEWLRQKFAKVLIFSHANDPDGLLCVMLCQLAFGHVDYLLTNSPEHDINNYLGLHAASQYDYVFITDIYPGKSVLKALPNVYWFDHKQHSIDKVAFHNLTLPHAVLQTTLNGRPTAASELIYTWLRERGLVSEDLRTIVEYIRKEDTWDYL